ncbi:MAG TPA: sugar-binding protein, partial [Armatimonadota bacterium]|nr:sugar-binding protein [Armatimonadota bacterium]
DATLFTAITTDRGTLTAAAFIPATDDALAVRLAGMQAGEEVIIEMEAWRPTMTAAAAGGVLLLADSAKYSGQPDYRYALAVSADGATAEAGQNLLTLRAPANSTIWAALAETRDPAADVVAAAKAKLAALRARGWAATRRAHADWWARFWSQSFISLSSDDGVADYLANAWYLHIYAMGAGSRGPVPPKFNGGLWLDDYDTREWGSAYWHWNTQETYWPLYAANHLELLAPYYRMYWEMLPTVEQRTKEYFGANGASYDETISFTGHAGRGEKVMGVHPRLAVPKHPGHTNLIFSSSAEIAMQFWWYYRYTGDETFLRERAYPLMKSVAAFYVDYLEKDEKGRYGMWPSNAHETFWKVQNPTPDLAGIRYLFPALLEASARLERDADLRPVWQDRLDGLAPYPLDPEKGSLLAFEPRPGEEVKTSNGENPDLFPIGVFPNITLGSPDYALGLTTFRNRRHVNTYGWTTDSIAAARLGLAEELATLLPDHLIRYQTHPSGLQDYYTRKPAVHPYLEGSGTFAAGVNEMLLQSWGGVIRVCPALPKAWSARFTLLAMGGFVITAQAEKGQVTYLAVTSQRGGVLRLVNPFPGRAIVQCNGKPVADLSSDHGTIIVPTEAGKTYHIGTTPFADVPATGGSWQALLKPNDAPKHLTPTSIRWLGKPEATIAGWTPPAEPNAPRPPAAAPVTRAARPEIHVAKLAGAPKVDGELSDPAWQGAAKLADFVLLGKTTLASQPTEVLIGHDAEHLYLGITCWEARMAGLIAEYGEKDRDCAVFLDDSVEIFLRPTPALQWHLAINALGARFDARGLTAETENASLNLPWTAAVQRKSNRWIVEIAIPFSALVPDPPGPASDWGFNVCRNEKPHGETSTWAPLSAMRFHLPEEFARLRFPHGPAPATDTPIDPHLVGWWTGDAIGGLWVRDRSGNGLHARMHGAVSAAEGKIGAGLALRGGYLEVPDAPALRLTAGMTLLAWVKPASAGSMRILDKGRAGHNDAYMMDTHPAGNLRVITSRGGFSQDVTLPLNAWSHLALTYDNAALTLYLNGAVLDTLKTAGPLTVTDLPLHIGADSGGGSRFSGVMDGVMLWSRALTAEEIRTYMTAAPTDAGRQN